MLKNRTETTYNIRRAVEDKFHKTIFLADLRNLRMELQMQKRAGRTESQMLQDWIAEFMEVPGNAIEKYIDDGGVLQCLFIQTKEMREAFSTYPEIMTIDGTFCVNAEHYLLYITMGQNGGLKGVPVSYCFMRSEIDPHLQFYYQSMAKYNDLSKTKIVFVDKDLRNIRMILRYK